MNVSALKIDIIQSVIETDNPVLLEKVAVYIKSLLAEDDWWDKLSENEKSFIHKSARQIDEGKVVSNAAVRAEVAPKAPAPQPFTRKAGTMKGVIIYMADDFDGPLEEPYTRQGGTLKDVILSIADDFNAPIL